MEKVGNAVDLLKKEEPFFGVQKPPSYQFALIGKSYVCTVH